MCRSLSRFISCVSHHHLPRSERCRSDRNKSRIRCRQRIQPKRTHTKRNMKKMTDFRVIISAKEKKVRFFYRIHDIRSDEKFVLFLTRTSTTKWSNVERRNVIFMKRRAKKWISDGSRHLVYLHFDYHRVSCVVSHSFYSLYFAHIVSTAKSTAFVRDEHSSKTQTSTLRLFVDVHQTGSSAMRFAFSIYFIHFSLGFLLLRVHAVR